VAIFSIALIVLGSSALQVRAQVSSAAITGHVIDQSQGAVPNAEVKLVEDQTNVTVTTHTNSNGDFNFTNEEPGTYTVIVAAPGYKELRKVNLVLSASQNLSAGSITLTVGSQTQEVTVEADITPLQTTSSERSGVIDTEQMDNLLAIGRDAMAMTRVIPGVVGSEGSTSMSQTSTPTVNGINTEYNMATVDGVTGNTRGFGTLDTPINLDAIQEVTVTESNYQAQYGKTAGAEVNFVTKSGTQKFHGGVYEYFRNEDLNANTYFDKFGTNIARPRYRYNTMGGTIGGPIYWPGKFNSRRDKLFFFVSVEDSPIKTPDGLKYYTVPTLLQTQGDFSQTYNQGTSTQTAATLINIRNPNVSGACAVNSATPGPACFAGNKITSGLLNSQGQVLLQTIYNNTLAKNPSYAFTNLAVSNNNYNYVTNYSADKPVNQELFRVDYAPTEKLHTFFRGEMTTVNDNDYSSPAAPLPWLMPVNYKDSQPNYVYNITYAFTPTLVNEFNIGTAGWSENQLYAASDLAKVQLSSSGFNLPSLYSGVNPMNLYPAASFGGVTNTATYSWDYRFPMVDQVRSYDAVDNLTKVWGPHTLKFGAEFERDHYLQYAHNRAMSLAFGHDTSNPNDSNFAYSNADLGLLDTFSQATGLGNYDPSVQVIEWYYQDTWKVSSKLTADFGIRNSWAGAQKVPQGNNWAPSLYNAANAPKLYIANSTGGSTDPTTGISTYPKAYSGLYVPNTGNINNGVLYTKTPGYPEGTVYGNGLLWGPRAGFAWSMTPKTVVRGGYGMFYNSRSRDGQQGDFGLNAPTVYSITQYYSSITSSASNYYMNAGGLFGPFSVSHAIPLHVPQLYSEEMSLGVQQQLRAGIVLDVAYVGTFTKHASDYTPINNVPYGAEFLPQNQYCSATNAFGCSTSSILPDNFFRPYPGIGGINMQYFNLTANYNSLQARVTRRFHNGLEFGAAYTFSKTMDYTDSYNGTVAEYQNLRKWNYGPAGYDHRQNLVVNYLWSIPKGSRLFADNPYWNNVVTREALDGWQISGIASYLSGAPGSIGLSLSNGQNVTGGGDGARVVLTCDPAKKVPHVSGTFKTWFNTSCVQPPIAGSPATIGTYDSKGNYTAPTAGSSYSLGVGNGWMSPKVNYYLPGNTNFDTALFKNMPVEKTGMVLQLRVETYNTFNHAEFSGVNSTATFANANSQGTTNPQTSAIFGQLSSTQNARLMQIALRLDF
jgi:hypothetical protein